MGTKIQFFDFQGIFDLQPNPTVLLSCDGIIQYTNKAMLNHIGLNLEEVRDRYFSSILREPFTRESFSFFKSRFKKGGIYEPLSVFLIGDSDTEWSLNMSYLNAQELFLVSFMPLHTSHPPHSSYEKNRLDFLAFQKLEQELEHLIYIIGHDLRAPMRAILGFSQILRDNYKELIDEDGLELFDIIQDNTRKLNALISDLLDFARISRTSNSLLPIDLEEVFSFEYNKLLTLQNEGRDIDFELKELHSIESDPRLIKLIVVELLSNAIKFTRKQTEAHVEVGGYVDAKGYTFYVKDNGLGFDMAGSERVFSIFEKLVLEEDFEGNGIGLARVNKAVQLLGGKVWTESEPDHGTTFFVFIPQGE